MAVSLSIPSVVVVFWNANEIIVVKHKKKAMERPGLVGPKGETLEMDADPLSDALVWRVESISSSEAEVGKVVKKRRRSNFEAVNKIYKRAKVYFVAFLERRRTTSSTGKSRNDTARQDSPKPSPNGRAQEKTVCKIDGKILVNIHERKAQENSV